MKAIADVGAIGRDKFGKMDQPLVGENQDPFLKLLASPEMFFMRQHSRSLQSIKDALISSKIFADIVLEAMR